MILQDKSTAVFGSEYYYKLLRASESVIEQKDGIVIKTFNYDRFNDSREDWLKSYNALRSWDPRYIEVYEVGSNFIKMKYEPNAINLSEVIGNKTSHSGDTRLKLLSDYIELLSSTYSYLAYSNEIFIHNELHPHNVLVNEKNELVVIDPDSCDYIPRFKTMLPNHISFYVKAMNRYCELLERKVYA